MAKEDFDLFWRTHLAISGQECYRPEVTLLYWNMTREESSNFPWARKEGTVRAHAIAGVARDLLTQIRVTTQKKVMDVAIVTNLSPCAQGAEELQKTLALAQEKKVRLTLSITFVALNGIRRPSWIWRGMRDLLYSVPLNQSNENSLALRELQKAGVRLSTFDQDSWKFLYAFLGNGLPIENRIRFLGGKHPNGDARLEEDKLMNVDFQQITKGMFLTSPSSSPSHSSLTIQWIRPVSCVNKITEYRITYRKASVKNKEEDERAWTIQQLLDKSGQVMTAVPELSKAEITELEPNMFYDVTVEGIIRGLVVCSARKICRTAVRVSIPSLQAPTTPSPRANKSTIVSRHRSVVDMSPSAQSGYPRPGSPQVPKTAAMGLKRSMSTLNSSVRNSQGDIRGERELKRWNSLRGQSNRPLAGGVTPARKVSDTTPPGPGATPSSRPRSATNSITSNSNNISKNNNNNKHVDGVRKISSGSGGSRGGGKGVFV